MISKEKGNIGEAIVLAELSKRGIQVCIPFGDNARYDLVADFNGKLNRIQVKYCGCETNNDSIICPCASSKNHTTNKKYDTYENDIDYFAFYLAKYQEVLLVPISVIGNKKSITFRKFPTKSGQKSGTNLIDDYLIDKILCVETLHDEPKE